MRADTVWMLDLRPFDSSTFGAEIHGLDLASELSDAAMGEVLDALYAHRFVVIKGQSLDKAGYLAFGRRLGRPVAHALDHLRMPGYPEIEPIGNVNEKDRDTAVRNGAAFWHTDQCYETEPASMIVLHALRMPEVGGETLIADMRSAYEDLDDGTRFRIDSLVVRHAYEAAQGGGGEERAIPVRTEAQRARLPAVRHRLAPSHPVTGARFLYAVAGFTCGVEGMENDEASALLDALKAHALRPRYVRRHRHHVGDVLVIDTLQTLHAALPSEFASGHHDARLLWRLGIKGAPKLREREWRWSAPGVDAERYESAAVPVQARATRASARNAALTAAESLNTSATSGSSRTTLVPRR